ncbi:MAG: ABC transporter substrate-binding protein [Acidimicrobiia bacterium]
MKMKKPWRLVAAVALVGTIAAACGDDSDSGSSDTTAAGSTAGGGSTAAPSGSTTTAAPKFDPNAILKAGRNLTTAADISFDPLKSTNPTPYGTQILVYGSLLTRDDKGQLQPGFATKWAVKDPQTISLELRPNLKFSDGKPLDMNAVKFSLERHARATGQTGMRPEMQQINTVNVIDPLKGEITFKTPVAGAFLSELDAGEGMIVSPDAAAGDLNTKPVGAGPFMLESATQADSIKLKKNPNYYAADTVRVAGITFTHVTPGASATNALRSGAVDILQPSTITADQFAALKGDSSFSTDSTVSPNTYGNIYMCKKNAPLDNKLVRQALNYAVDRDVVITTIQNGLGEPAWGMWPKGHKFYDASLDGVYKRDVNKAKQLLAQAGFPNGLTIDTYFSPGGDRLAELIQNQVKEAGITLTISPTTDPFNDFLVENSKKPMWIASFSGAATRRLTRLYLPEASTNPCRYNNPTLNGLVAQLLAVSEDDPKAVDLWKQIQQLIIRDEALAVQLAFSPVYNAWSNKIGGVSFEEGEGNAVRTPSLAKLYVKA